MKSQLSEINSLKNNLIIIIIIIIYPGIDGCNNTEINSTWNVFDKDFTKNIGIETKNNLFWIYKNDENLQYYYPKKINWQKDKNSQIEKLFYKIHYPCSSSTVIDMEGNFISNLGEFGKQQILEDIKTLTK